MTSQLQVEKHPEERRYSIRVLDRAIQLLSVMSDGKARSLSEISRATMLSNPTTFRLLHTLEYHGYIQRDSNEARFRLGPACLRLGQAYLDTVDVRRVAVPILEELRDHSRETVHLAVLENLEVFYLEKIPGFHTIGLMTSRVGTYAPAHCTALGKVLLASMPAETVRDSYERSGLQALSPNTITDLDTLMRELDVVREQGYALDCGEREPEVRCVAAPIHRADGLVIAALSVSGPAHRMEEKIGQGTIVKAVREAARTISARVSGSPGS